MRLAQTLFIPAILIASVTAQGRQYGASIQGRVTLGDKPAQNVVVTLGRQRPAGQGSGLAPAAPAFELKAITDADGRYRFAGLAAGRYGVGPAASAYVTQAKRAVTVNEGDNLDGIDFVLVSGGVITGKVTKAGRPLVMETVSIIQIDGSGKEVSSRVPFAGQTPLLTDDRGVYRAYGLPAGRYLVSVGKTGGGAGMLIKKELNVRVFHPGVSDKSGAKAVDVQPGAETADVDIKVDALPKTFRISGRVFNFTTGGAVPNVIPLYYYSPPTTQSAQSDASGVGAATNAAGEFNLEGLAPGRYKLSALLSANGDSETYSETTIVDLGDGDVSGVEIKVRQGVSVAGVVSLEGAGGMGRPAQLSGLQVAAQPVARETAADFAWSPVAADGSFRLRGLKPGRVRFTLIGDAAAGAFALLRIERTGQSQPPEIDLSDGQQVTDLRLILGYAGGVVRGRVRVEGGELSKSARLTVVARLLGAGEGAPARLKARTAQVEETGNFLIEGLLPGEYELTVTALLDPGAPREAAAGRTAKQLVRVSNEAPTDTSIVLNISPRVAP